jgi:hypothetical protein
MAETTNPTAGVGQAAPAATLTESILEDAFGGKPTPKAAPEAEPKQESAPELTDEVTPDDIPDEVAAAPQEPDGDAWEIVHNGQQVKLTRAEVIENASKGFDYTRKTEALAADKRQVEERLARVAEIEQIAPILQQDLGQLAALEAQLKQYSNVDWVKLATDDPLGYPQHYARFTQLRETYQGVANQFHQKQQYVQAQKQALSQQQLGQEFQRLTERIPEWKDAQKYETGRVELRNYLINQGASQADVDGLASSVAVSIARKAMLYDNLLKAKGEKVKQMRSAPPVVKPGSSVSQSGLPKADLRKDIAAAGRKGNHRAQEDLMAQALGRAFK